MSISGIDVLFALAHLTFVFGPPPETWTLEPITVYQQCREEPTPYGRPKWGWRDTNRNRIEWCQNI